MEENREALYEVIGEYGNNNTVRIYGMSLSEFDKMYSEAKSGSFMFEAGEQIRYVPFNMVSFTLTALGSSLE